MSNSFTKLGGEFLRIPKLDVAGTNWVVYKDRFLWSIDARGLLDHLEGMTVEPADLITPDVRGGTTPLDAEQALADKEWKREVKRVETGGSCGKATDSWDHTGLVVHEDLK